MMLKICIDVSLINSILNLHLRNQSTFPRTRELEGLKPSKGSSRQDLENPARKVGRELEGTVWFLRI